MEILKKKLEEILIDQNQIKNLVEKNEKNIINNNMSDYMKNEKTITLKINLMKMKEKELVSILSGKKITEKINEAELNDKEKENLLKITDEMKENYKKIDETFKKMNLYIEAKMDLGALIAEAITEEVGKTNATGGKLYNEKI